MFNLTSGMFFYKESPESIHYEQVISDAMSAFLDEATEKNLLQGYVKTFGLFGPAARQEGFRYDDRLHSDTDFFVLTTQINPWKAKKLEVVFQKHFYGLDASLLFFSPRSLTYPDLMLYEISHSSQVYWGDPVPIVNIFDVPTFEGYRNLIYRGAFFLRLLQIKDGVPEFKKELSQQDKWYAFSKVIFAVEEVCLLLTGTYTADNHKRRGELIKNQYAEKIPDFLSMHQEIFTFRYENKLPEKIEEQKMIHLALHFLIDGFTLLQKHLFEQETFTPLEHIDASGISLISSRVFFILNRLSRYRSFKIHIRQHPFIALINKTLAFLKMYNEGHPLKQDRLDEILKYRKVAPWLYYRK